MKDIAIYGAGGYGREIACLIQRINNETDANWNLVGFFDDGLQPGDENEYGKVLGNIDTLNSWDRPLAVVFAIGSPRIVEMLSQKISNPHVDFPNIFAPDTLFFDKDNIRLGKGNVFCYNCIISCNVTIGDFNTFNGLITIGHDTIIGDCNSVMPSVNISGGVRMGNRNFLGVNSVVLQYLTIGNDVTIGAGAVVMRNTKDNNTYVGSPAKKLHI